MLQEPGYYQTLNVQQREAVLQVDGPLLVLAGAGTGKTRVLTTRIAHILNSNKALPGQILAVTFTNKAAKEMSTRIKELLESDSSLSWCGTFHSISARILRNHAELFGFSPNFVILDTDDQLRILKQMLIDFNIDEKKYPAKLLAYIVGRYKDKGWTPNKVPATEENNFANGAVHSLYAEYQKRLKFLQAMDFGDLILNVNELFNSNLDLLEHYHRKFKYLLVDEYQDTNVAQYLWLRLLAQGSHNICCVGDDDQSIYGWRGAEVKNILRFEQDFPNAKIIRLERNYRSTSCILDAASELISHNKNRHGKVLWTENHVGENIKLSIFYDDKQEAREIANEIDAKHRLYKKPLTDMAILIRAGYQTRSFEESLNYMKIPYRIVGGAKFYDRVEIKDALCYMRLINNPDDSLAFERVINTPRRGIGDATISEVRAKASGLEISMFAASEVMLASSEFRSKTAFEIGNFIANIGIWRNVLETDSHVVAVDRMLDQSGYRDMLKALAPEEAKDKLDNIKELIKGLEDFASLSEYLEHVSLITDNDSKADDANLSILTMHAAKGLEFDTVFLPGWEEGVFPSGRATSENGATALEEERRLAYVAITRAKNNLYISYACNRRIYGTYQSSESSRFISELPKSSYEVINNFGNYSNSFSQYGKIATQYKAIPEADGNNAKVVSKYGKRVSHKKFGQGSIIAVLGDNIAQVMFDNCGFKKISMDYLEVL